jgi:hypothetical protein
LEVRATPKAVTFDFGEWRGEVASRTNDDGTQSFIDTTPGHAGFHFIVGKEQGGRRRLIIREAQHEYVFEEAAVR